MVFTRLFGPQLGIRQVEDAGREIHRPGEQPRERQDRFVVGRIAAVGAPGVVFLAAGAFAGHQIRIGAAEAGRLDRLVDVEHDVVLGRFFDHVLVMPDHVLAVVPFAARACRRRRAAAGRATN